MSLTEEEAQVIQSGIEGAMNEAKSATCTAQVLAAQVAELRARLQELLDRPSPPTICPHCGAHMGNSG